jgi:hypothetical protein
MFITEAHSYIDPGTGSIILQAIIGGIAALGFSIKLYWYKIKSFFKKKIKNKQTATSFISLFKICDFI